MKQLTSLVFVAFLLGSVFADLYCHEPRGSNNRLNEETAQRANGNRLFDSQNNNRGGYNVGDKTPSDPADPGTSSLGAMVDPADNSNIQYSMVYYEGSIMPISWTSQHGCGGTEDGDSNGRNCNMVIQFMCDGNAFSAATNSVDTEDLAMQVQMRDGTDTNTIGTDGNGANNGYQESVTYYEECQTRPRNHGLYLADDTNGNNLRGDSAIYTRQNPDGTRRGLECPEERDYYPYFVATPWRDVVYLTDRTDLCPFIQANSQNNNIRTRCYNGPNPNSNTLSATNENDCTNRGGTWKQYRWDLPAPECKLGEYGRDNHLGNSRGTQPLGYNWTVPAISTLKGATIYTDGATSAQYAKCILRLRYNISTDDYDPWTTNYSRSTSANPAAGTLITTNPTVDIGADLQGLKLAINTNQFGRTFQDRSHVFYIRTRPANIPGTAKVFNLNVRGKRGNIVQVYPGVEYDFAPGRLHVKSGDFIHIQWTGSNTHKNNGDGGDGQAGDDGQGTDGTDRQNFVQMNDLSDSYPIPLDTFPNNMFTRARCYQLSGTEISSTPFGTTNVDCALWLATSGFYRTTSAVVGTTGADNMSPLLNNVNPSLVGGVVMQLTLPGGVTDDVHYHYMCTRNNNFSNRHQKGTIIVSP